MLDARMVATILSVICRTAISSSIVGFNVWQAELYPTSVRHRLFAYATGVASVVTLAAPYIGGGLVRMSNTLLHCYGGVFIV